MNKADAARLVAIIIAAYPNYDRFRDGKAVEATVNLWASMFADDDSHAVAIAVKQHIAIEKWPPSVAELRARIAKNLHPELIPPEEAWVGVSDTIFAEGEFCAKRMDELFPPLIARAVDAIGWGNLVAAHKNGNGRTLFIQQYTPLYQRALTEAMLPPSLSKNNSSAFLQQAAKKRKTKEEQFHRAETLKLLAGGKK